jgi:predicted lysophospholipase L1 biosynthesis ABC-type transport system permease subunit
MSINTKRTLHLGAAGQMYICLVKGDLLASAQVCFRPAAPHFFISEIVEAGASACEVLLFELNGSLAAGGPAGSRRAQ